MTQVRCGESVGVWAVTVAALAVTALLGAWGGHLVTRKVWR